MKNRELIERLISLPLDAEVCIFDHRKNAFNSDEDGSSSGIESEFEVETVKEGDKEFIAISFFNDDYNDDATVNEGSLIFNVCSKASN